MDRPDSRTPTKEEIDLLLRTVQTPSISKAVLQALCAVNGLPKTGNKADLQKRLMKLIGESRSDSQKLGEIRASIRTLAGIPLAQPPPPPQPQTSYYPPASPRGQSTTQYAMPPYNPPGTYLPVSNGHRANLNSTPYAQLSTLSPTPAKDQSILARPNANANLANRVLTTSAGFSYKPSPFHEIFCQLGEMKTLMPQNRNSVTIPLKAQDSHHLQQCSTDSRYKVMVFCAAGNSGPQEVSFPHQSELKVNGGDVKANLRGLKNKPGSTRPVDITPFLRLKPPSYANTVEFTYALTQKKFYFGVYVCKTTPVEALVDRIHKKISKHTVVADISKKASDPDVVATSQNISLKCPLSYMRLQTPCRAYGCSHVQCFDATSYLQLQEQGPQWVCPICNKPAPYEQLAIDEYVTEIIKGTPDSVEQVTIEPDGHWVLPGAAQKKKTKSVSQDASFLDEDDFFISDMFQTPNQHRSTPTLGQGGSVTSAATAYLDTPSNSASRDSSAIPKSATSNKRTMSEVIDLTLSDDDEPPRPSKRTNYGGSNGYGY